MKFALYGAGVWTGLVVGYVATSYLADRVWVRRYTGTHAAVRFGGGR